jgi:aryl carrier-like protein
MNIRRGLARIANDQAEHLTTPAVLVQNGLQGLRITRLVIFGIEIVSFLPGI